MYWKNRVEIRYLFTEKEDYESIQVSMNKIADVFDSKPFFASFKDKAKFRKIPKRNDNDIITSLDYANYLIDRMYDYADENSIWIY